MTTIQIGIICFVALIAMYYYILNYFNKSIIKDYEELLSRYKQHIEDYGNASKFDDLLNKL